VSEGLKHAESISDKLDHTFSSRGTQWSNREHDRTTNKVMRLNWFFANSDQTAHPTITKPSVASRPCDSEFRRVKKVITHLKLNVWRKIWLSLQRDLAECGLHIGVTMTLLR